MDGVFTQRGSGNKRLIRKKINKIKYRNDSYASG